MIEHLRQALQEYLQTIRHPGVAASWYGSIEDKVSGFIDWYERTGASPWVSMEERTPEEGKDIVALHGTPLTWMFNGFYVDVRKYCAADKLCLDYWMPLPPLPKEKPCAS